jgi:serine/threonine protein kinase/Tfp pilus assembly protein PilF
MRAAWRNGERPLAEDFFRLHPELRSDADAAIRLVYEELCLREECGQRMASLEVAKRFPQWESRLRFLLSFRAHLQPSPSAAMPGEESDGMLPLPAVHSEKEDAAFAPPAFSLRSGEKGKVSLEEARGSQAPDESLAAQLAEEMKAAWRQGQRPMAEDFFSRHPELCHDPESAVRLIYEEICLRQEYGLDVASVEVVKRFPQWQAQLRFLLDCHGLLKPIPAVPIFPRVGDTWSDFRLQAELGRGTFGRVFLAAQQSLADRPIVLKMMAVNEGEHLSLARLQHTHIMPLFFVQDDTARHLRALCMPYFGGTSLHHILEVLKGKPVGERTGLDILNALDQVQAALPVTLPHKGPARQLLIRASYVQAVCWIGACLAEALQYAHDRGLVHLDVKPHNVLLASDGQPLLLDFNLARGPLRPDALVLDAFGGTPEYMSPEQELAWLQMRAHLPIRTGVDARSDIYSLGLMLYQALGGPLPGKASPPYLADCNRQVSLGFADLIRKCLAHDACDRYPDAAALAADLRRQLADLPLRGVLNRSLRERWLKWRHRRPHALVQTAMLLTLVMAALVAGIYAWGNRNRQLREAEMALADGEAQLHSHAYAAAVLTLNRGIALVEGLPVACPLQQRLGGQLRLAQRAQAAHQLHLVTERLRFLYGMDPIQAKGDLEAQCRKVWDVHDLMTQGAGGELEPDRENQIKDDLRDLAILWGDLHVRLATNNRAHEARQDALRLLVEAEALFGPSVAIARARQVYAQALGRPDLAQDAARRALEPAPETAWDHYSVGQFLLRSGRPTEALVEFEQALDLHPAGFWPNFYQGVCAYRVRRYDEAVNAFRVCLALEPERAECFYNRALAQAALGRTERALHDYTRALQIDPTLASAALNRGILHYHGKRFGEALADFKRALENGADPGTTHYNMALVHLARKNRDGALNSLRNALDHRREDKPARELYDRLLREP